MRRHQRVLAAALALAAAGARAANCPSASTSYAQLSLEATAHGRCDEVLAEIEARVSAQGKTWHDPHSGKYSETSSSNTEIKLSHATTIGWIFPVQEQIVVDLAPIGENCRISACSQSQEPHFGRGDGSRNYCSIRNLYCGSADGCQPVIYDFPTDEGAVVKNSGTGQDWAQCRSSATVEVAGSADDQIDGFYTDPNHYKAGSLAGTRMVSGRTGDALGETITLIGSDDGVSFWTLFGKFTSSDRKQLNIDFSPKGGPSDLSASYANGRISFGDGNTWTRLSAPPSAAENVEASADIGGFYKDPNHFKAGSFAGTRFISDELGDKPGDDLHLVGSDDGVAFWTVQGKFSSKETGALQIDFTPKGGPVITGTFAGDSITFSDGNVWRRQEEVPVQV